MTWWSRAAAGLVLVLATACSGDDAGPDRQADGGPSASSSSSSSTTVTSAPGTPPPGATDAAGEAPPAPDLADCARQVQAVRDNGLTTDFSGALEMVDEWERSGCEAACGPLAAPTADPACLP